MKPNKPSESTPGNHGKSILLAGSALLDKEWEQECEVVSVGPRAKEEMEKEGRAFEPGDRVLLSVYEGLEGVRTFKRGEESFLSIDYHKIAGRILPLARGTFTVDGRGKW